VDAFGVVVAVEDIDLRLQDGHGLGRRLAVKILVQGLMKALVLALGRRFVRLAGDRFDPAGLEEIDELTALAASGRIQSRPIVGKKFLRHAMAFDGQRDDRDRSLAGFPGSDQRGQSQTGMIVHELKHRYRFPAGQGPFRGIDLPACVRLWISEALVGTARPLPRLRNHGSGP